MARMARVLCLALAGCCFVGHLGPLRPVRVARAASEDGLDPPLKCGKDRGARS